MGNDMDIEATIDRSSQTVAKLQVNPDLRQRIMAVEKGLECMPGAYIGNKATQIICPIKESFTEDLYMREIFIPKGVLIVGALHKFAHTVFIQSGEVSVLSELGLRRLKAPFNSTMPMGIKNVVYAHEDAVWITVHPIKDNVNIHNNMDEELAFTGYDELDAYNLLQGVEQCLLA